MDEKTLSELLECSVCLERLDISSKVLPCQHTFCKKCLEVIVASHQELRCPECRVLVDIKVDELPPNILLIRILEGMNNSSIAHRNEHQHQQSQNHLNRQSAIVNDAQNDLNITQDFIHFINENQSRALSNQQNSSNKQKCSYAIALYDFIAKEKGDLNFKKGDTIFLKRKLDSNWLIGEVNGKEGTFPANHVKIIIPLEIPQCIALYNFKMGPNEDEGCLTFKKGSVINVLRRIDHNWAEGQIESKIGIFPIAFVELNSLAKELLETDRSYLTSSSNSFTNEKFASRILPSIINDNSNNSLLNNDSIISNSPCSSNNTSKNSQSPNSSGVGMNENFQNQSTATTTEDLPTNSIANSSDSNIEISNIPSSTTTNSDSASLSVPVQTPTPPVTLVTDPLVTPVNKQQIKTFRTVGRKVIINLPWAYVAVYPYKPKKPDELELKKGCVYIVTERCLDGWCKGKSLANKSGVFPGNYVIPLSDKDQQIVNQQKDQTNSQQHPQHNVVHNHQQQHQLHHPPDLPPRNTNRSINIWSRPLSSYLESTFAHRLNNQEENNATNIENTKISNVKPVTTSLAAPLSSKEKQRKETTNATVNLMKRLTNLKNSSKSNKSNNLKPHCIDNPVFEDTTISSSAATGSKSALIPSSSKQSAIVAHAVHVRSGSCPSQLLQNLSVDDSVTLSPLNVGGLHGSQRIKNHKNLSNIQASMRQQQKDYRVCESISVGNLTANTSSNKTSNILLDNKAQNQQHQQHQQQQAQPQHNHLYTAINTNKNSLIVLNNTKIQHQKTQSFDANVLRNPPDEINSSRPSTSQAGNNENPPLVRCIVPYPPNSDVELELNVGDIIIIHKKLKNGWYKGQHTKTNKIGLFPATFVEPKKGGLK